MMRCFQGDRKMKHGKKCKIDKYTLILSVLLLLLTGLVIAWKLPQKEDRYIHVGIAVYDRSDTFMESYIRELEDKIGQTRILGKKVSYEMVKILLEHGKVGFRGCVSKRGNKFSAYFYYEKDEKTHRYNWRLEFIDTNPPV